MGIAHVPDERLWTAGRDVGLQQARAHRRGVRRHRRAGQGRQHRGGAGQPSSSARCASATPSCSCSGPSRTRRWIARRRPRPGRRSRHPGVRAGPGRPGVRRGPPVPPARRRPRATSRSLPRSPPWSRRPGPSTTAPRCTGPPLDATSASCSAVVPAHHQAGPGRRQHRRGPARRRPTSWPRPCARDDALARVPPARGRGRAASSPRSGPSCSRGSGSARASCPGSRRAAYHLLGRRTFLTTGRQGEPGLDVPGRRQGARVRRRDPLRPAARLHPGRGDPLGRAARASGRGRRPRSRASCGSRARTTRSPTATCSRSASTCDGGSPGHDGLARCATATCWPAPRCAATGPGSAAQGLLGRDGVR